MIGHCLSERNSFIDRLPIFTKPLLAFCAGLFSPGTPPVISIAQPCKSGYDKSDFFE
jgi:hypothetical protein